MFLLLFNPDDPHILAVQKADVEGYPWRNQIALPGGHVDAGEDPLDAAFRELQEEVNIGRHQVDCFGSLGHYQTINNRDIEAFSGAWSGSGVEYFDPKEISRVLEIPLKDVVHTHLQNNYRGRIPGVQELTYPYDGVVIWGVTARILHFFVETALPLLEKSGFFEQDFDVYKMAAGS